MRAQEKALVLAERFAHDFYVPAMAISRVCGVCFVIVGGTLSISLLEDQLVPVCGTACQAQVIESAAVTTDRQSTELGVATVTALDAVPPVVSTVTGIPIAVSNLSGLDAMAITTTVAGVTTVTTLLAELVGSDKYRIIIDPASLSPGTHELKVRAQSAVADDESLFTLGTFAVIDTAAAPAVVDAQEPDEEPPEAGEFEEPIETPGTSDENSLGAEVVDPNNSVGTTALEESETTSQPDYTEARDQSTVLGTDALFTVTEVARVDEQIETDAEELEQATSLTLRGPALGTGVVTLTVTVDNSVSDVELYVRAVQGRNTQFLGTLAPNQSTFPFNTTVVPNGTYELYATGAGRDGVVHSNSLQVAVRNATAETERTTAADVLTESRPLLTIRDVLTESEADPGISSEISSSTRPTVRDQVAVTTRERLTTDRTELDELFTAYAAAAKPGDAATIAAAKRAIDEYRAEIVDEA